MKICKKTNYLLLSATIIVMHKYFLLVGINLLFFIVHTYQTYCSVLVSVSVSAL